MSGTDDAADIADLIIDIAREIRLRGVIDAPGVPLNQTQSQVMRHVHRNPGCTVTEIAESTALKRANVSPALAELRRLGYLETAADSEDRRVTRVAVTPLAERTVACLRAEWGRILQDALGEGAHIDPVALHELRRLYAGLLATRRAS